MTRCFLLTKVFFRCRHYCLLFYSNDGVPLGENIPNYKLLQHDSFLSFSKSYAFSSRRIRNKSWEFHRSFQNVSTPDWTTKRKKMREREGERKPKWNFHRIHRRSKAISKRTWKSKENENIGPAANDRNWKLHTTKHFFREIKRILIAKKLRKRSFNPDQK